MFRIEDALNVGAKKVVDPERNVWLGSISGRREGGSVMRLVVGAKVIPFEVSRVQEGSVDSGLYYVTRFESFGSSALAQMHAGIEPAVFGSPEERFGYMLLAAEALLIYGSIYNGEMKPEGYNQVELDGHIYTLASFGYDRPRSL